MKKLVAIGMVLLMFFGQSVKLALAANVVPGEKMDFATMVDKVSDPDTSNHTLYFNDTTLENGRMWGDKSVNSDAAPIYGADGNLITTAPTAANEFMTTLSALSQSYTASVPTPIDAVFVLDVSGSMIEAGNEVDGESRLAVMVDALNESIRILMEANPENRVAVVTFGGQHGVKSTMNDTVNGVSLTPIIPEDQKEEVAGLDVFDTRIRPSRVATMLDLGSVTIPENGQVFTVTSRNTTNNPNEDAQISIEVTTGVENVVTPSVYAAGGTPTARGIYQGAQILANRTDTTVEIDGTTFERQPNVILMTDGDPTLGYSTFSDYAASNPYFTAAGNEWWTADRGDVTIPFHHDLGHDMGNSINTDIGIDFMTILTASYWEKQITSTYGVDAGFYNIGLGLEVGDNVSQNALAVLDPATHAGLISQVYEGTTYQLSELLNQFVQYPNTEIDYPAIERNTAPDNGTIGSDNPLRRLETTKNNAGVASYEYNDLFISAESASDLTEAFTQIADTMLKKVQYATAVDPEHPTWKGHVVFSDVIGEYMEFGRPVSLWVEGQGDDYAPWNGLQWAQDMINGGERRAQFIEENFMHYQPPGVQFDESNMNSPEALAAKQSFSDMIDASIVGGSIYANLDETYGNSFVYYTNRDREFLGSYFRADGSVATPPAGATAYVHVYVMSGDAKDQVTGETTDLHNISLQVLTALEDSYFEDAYSNGQTQIRFLEKGQQVVRWYIPGNLVPLRHATPVVDETGVPTGDVDIDPAPPIRVLYTVKLRDDLSLKDVKNAYKVANKGINPVTGTEGIYFYTNDWHKQGEHPADYDNTAKYFFEPNQDNPFYYLTDDLADSQGNVPLWVEDNGYRLATAGDTGPFYTRMPDVLGADHVSTLHVNFWDADSNGLQDGFILVEDESLVTTDGNGTPVIPAQTVRNGFIYQAEAKTANPTETNPDMKRRDGFMGSIEDNPTYVATHLLGNDGRINIPFTEVSVEKVWLDEEMTSQSVFIQLYANGEPVGKPAELKADDEDGHFLARHTWSELPLFLLEPDADGNVDLITYTIAEGSVDSQGAFTPFGTDNPPMWIDEGGKEYPMHVETTQPIWNSEQSVWELGRVVNSFSEEPTPPTEPPTNPSTTPPTDSVDPMEPENPGNPPAGHLSQTGDLMPVLWGGLILVLIGGVSYFVYLRRKTVE